MWQHQNGKRQEVHCIALERGRILWDFQSPFAQVFGLVCLSTQHWYLENFFSTQCAQETWKFHSHTHTHTHMHTHAPNKNRDVLGFRRPGMQLFFFFHSMLDRANIAYFERLILNQYLMVACLPWYKENGVRKTFFFGETSCFINTSSLTLQLHFLVYSASSWSAWM